MTTGVGAPCCPTDHGHASEHGVDVGVTVIAILALLFALVSTAFWLWTRKGRH